MSCLQNTWEILGVYVRLCLDEAFHRRLTCLVRLVRLSAVINGGDGWACRRKVLSDLSAAFTNNNKGGAKIIPAFT